MNKLIERIIKARTARGMNQSDLAAALKVSPQAVQKWENGGMPRSSRIAEIAKALGVTEQYLLVGDGSAPQANASSDSRDDLIQIAQYSTGGQGGAGLNLEQHAGVIKSWYVDQNWLRTLGVNYSSTKNLYIVTGYGDSMPETFNHGDPVLIDAGVKSCDHDGIYFFRVGNDGFIKRLQRIPGKGILALSQNPEYQTWTITEDMDFEIFGKVLRAWRGKNY